MTKRLKAERKLIPAAYFAQAEMDYAKVLKIARHIMNGGEVPPVVVALYGEEAMPLDGHHRMEAHRILRRDADAYVVNGDDFDELCTEERNAEAFVMCDGVPAMKVADEWQRGNPAIRRNAE